MEQATILSIIALVVSSLSAVFTGLIWWANRASAKEAVRTRRESRLIEIDREANNVIALTRKADTTLQKLRTLTRPGVASSHSAAIEASGEAENDIRAVGDIQTFARSVTEDKNLSSRTDEELVELKNRLSRDAINLDHKLGYWEQRVAEWNKFRDMTRTFHDK